MTILLGFLRPLVPYVMLVVAMLVVLAPVYQKIKSERDDARDLLAITQDSLHREQATRAETQVRLLEMEKRDNVVMARYERAMRERDARIDSMKGTLVTLSLVQQRQFLKAKIGAIPRLIRDELANPLHYETPVSYWRAETRQSLTCYDSAGVASIVAVASERDCLRDEVATGQEAFERLKKQFSDYYEAVDYVGNMGWTRSKKRAIRRLNANTVIPP